ncbi:MAG: DUF6159 family protein [Candidatus Geothermincolia bacterium]
MGGTWSNSIELLKASWGVLRKHKSLVAFPIISTVATIVLIAALMVPAYLLTGMRNGHVNSPVLYYVFFFIFYFIASFIVIFFNTGLIACAHQALRGEDPTFAYGFDVAKKNIGKIAGWALISATVGLILKMIRERAGILGAIIAGIIGFAWNLIVFFVIPVFVFQGFGVIDSIKESASLFRRTWGENMIARFSLGLIFFVLGLLGIIPIVLAVFTKNAVVIIGIVALVLAYWTVLAVLSASLNGILATALYQYAISGQVPAAYNQGTITSAFQQKPQGRFGRR